MHFTMRSKRLLKNYLICNKTSLGSLINKLSWLRRLSLSLNTQIPCLKTHMSNHSHTEATTPKVSQFVNKYYREISSTQRRWIIYFRNKEWTKLFIQLYEPRLQYAAQGEGDEVIWRVRTTSNETKERVRHMMLTLIERWGPNKELSLMTPSLPLLEKAIE